MLSHCYPPLPKPAYLVPSATMNYTASGADDNTDIYTGKWEVSIIPTTSEVQEDHINVALWKKKAGVKRSNVKGTADNMTDNVSAKVGKTYGNGTANPVVGYAVVDDTGVQYYVETAQLKWQLLKMFFIYILNSLYTNFLEVRAGKVMISM